MGSLACPPQAPAVIGSVRRHDYAVACGGCTFYLTTTLTPGSIRPALTLASGFANYGVVHGYSYAVAHGGCSIVAAPRCHHPLQKRVPTVKLLMAIDPGRTRTCDLRVSTHWFTLALQRKPELWPAALPLSYRINLPRFVCQPPHRAYSTDYLLCDYGPGWAPNPASS